VSRKNPNLTAHQARTKRAWSLTLNQLLAQRDPVGGWHLMWVNYVGDERIDNYVLHGRADMVDCYIIGETPAYREDMFDTARAVFVYRPYQDYRGHPRGKERIETLPEQPVRDLLREASATLGDLAAGARHNPKSKGSSMSKKKWKALYGSLQRFTLQRVTVLTARSLEKRMRPRLRPPTVESIKDFTEVKKFHGRGQASRRYRTVGSLNTKRVSRVMNGDPDFELGGPPVPLEGAAAEESGRAYGQRTFGVWVRRAEGAPDGDCMVYVVDLLEKGRFGVVVTGPNSGATEAVAQGMVKRLKRVRPKKHKKQ